MAGKKKSGFSDLLLKQKVFGRTENGSLAQEKEKLQEENTVVDRDSRGLQTTMEFRSENQPSRSLIRTWRRGKPGLAVAVTKEKKWKKKIGVSEMAVRL